MIKNYIKIAWRNLLRDKVFSSINILGLATGMVVALAIIQYARFELSFESTHEKSDRVARISLDYINEGTIAYQDAESYKPLGPRLKADFPEVIEFARATRLDMREFTVKEKRYKEEGIYVADHTFFDIFSYQFIEGDSNTALNNPYEIVLTESTAQRFFDKTSVVGETIKSSSTPEELTVVGVIEDSPYNTHLKFDALISFKTGFTAWNWKQDNWQSYNDYTYVLFEENSSFNDFQRKLIRFSDQLRDEKLIDNEEVVAQLIADIHLYSKKGFEPEPPGDATTVIFLLIIAGFVLLIAWVNYVNLSTAKSLQRAKEVGIRKVVGSSLGQLRKQFLMETALSNLIAGIIAISILQITLPYYLRLTGLPSDLYFGSDPIFWITLIGLLVFGTILSGIYPAIVLASYQPVLILKGKFSSSAKGQRLRQALVVLQFSLTIILLTGTFSLKEQLQFMRTKELGMDINQVLVVDAPFNQSERENVDVFKNALASNELFSPVTLSDAVPGLPENLLSTTSGVRPKGMERPSGYNFHIYAIDDQFIDVVDMALLAGESFIENQQNRHKILVNEETLRLWEIEDPNEAIGLKVDLWGEERTVIGVVKNFHQMSVKSAHLAMILFHISNQNYWQYASLKIGGSDVMNQVELVQEAYETAFPGSVFSYFFMDERFDRQYQAEEQFISVFLMMTTLAIFIAGLGLFGLVSFTISQKTKEIGIRKVLGASVSSILGLLSAGFLRLVVVACLFSVPIAYLSVSSWLEQFPYRIEVYWWILAIPVLMIFLVAIFSISLESLKAANRNPVEALRYE